MSHIDREKRYGARNYAPLEVVLSRGEGVWLWDEEGRKYLDGMSAYSAVSLGHSHPRILRTLTDQAARLSIVSRAFYTDVLGDFLADLTAVAGMEAALPMNTGAEAVETAIKAARRWGHQVKGIPAETAEIIVASGNFHGRTTTIISFSSDEDYRKGFGPFTPGFRIVPFGDADALAAAISPRTCAVLLEPIQGESGIVIPPAGYLKKVREVCDWANVLLILDEIQSGLCRTGKWFAFEHEGIRPDGITVGKALGGGMLPVSAFISRREVMDVFTPGSHGSTFGGNCLAAAVGRETLRVMREEKLADRSADLGRHALMRLNDMRSPVIRAVRGCGLWIGIDIDPNIIGGKALCKALMKRGLLTKETHEHTIRFAPPLVINRAELDWALDQIEDTLHWAAKQAA